MLAYRFASLMIYELSNAETLKHTPLLPQIVCMIIFVLRCAMQVVQHETWGPAYAFALLRFKEVAHQPTFSSPLVAPVDGQTACLETVDELQDDSRRLMQLAMAQPSKPASRSIRPPKDAPARLCYFLDSYVESVGYLEVVPEN